MNSIRFQSPDHWERVQLKDIAKIKSGSTPLRAQNERYFSNGTIPWVKTMDLTNGNIEYTDERITELALKESSCPILEPGTVLVAMYGGFNQIGRTGLMRFSGSINQAISALLIDSTKAIPQYVLYWLNLQVKQWRTFAASSRKDPNITRKDVENFPILLPPLVEQRKIAAILSTWDEAIALTERLIAALQERKKGLMQRVIIGEMRFPGFEDEPKDTTLLKAKRSSEQTVPPNWGYTLLGEVTFESRDRAAQNKKLHLPVVGVNNVNGLNTNPKYFAEDLSRYKVIKPGMFAYNPMRLNIGSIGYCTPKIGEGLVSPDYVVFGCYHQKVNPDFLYYCTQSDEWKSWTNKAGAGSVRIRIYYNEVSQYPIMLPPLAEQQKIVEVLSTADEEISLRKQYLESLQQQKKGLMQRLLTGEVRVKVKESFT